MSTLPTAKEAAFPDLPAMGSGKLVTPCDRMHRANCKALEPGELPEGSDDPDDPETPDDVDVEPDVVEVDPDDPDAPELDPDEAWGEPLPHAASAKAKPSRVADTTPTRHHCRRPVVKV